MDYSYLILTDKHVGGFGARVLNARFRYQKSNHLFSQFTWLCQFCSIGDLRASPKIVFNRTDRRAAKNICRQERAAISALENFLFVMKYFNLI